MRRLLCWARGHRFDAREPGARFVAICSRCGASDFRPYR